MRAIRLMVILPATALLLAACGSLPRQQTQPHVTPRGIVIKNFHAESVARDQAQRSAVRPPWWPATRP